jgi:hypothetical protein
MAMEMMEYVADRFSCTSLWIEETDDARSVERELDEWKVKETIDWYELKAELPKSKEIDIATQFSDLVREWKEETWSFSSVKRRVIHSAYLKIIGMGPVAIPLLLKELRSQPDHWFHALEAITRQDPAPAGANMKEIAQAWIDWGEKRGYRHSR